MTLSTDEIANKLENTVWSNDFSYQQLLLLSNYLEFHHVQANSTIYNDGDEGLSMAILIKGRVRVCKHNNTIADLRAGRTFGEMSLLDNQRRSASVLALTECDFLTLDKSNFEKLSSERPALALKIMRKIAYQLSQEIRKMTGQLSEYMGD